MAIEIEDLLLLGVAGLVGYKLATRKSAATQQAVQAASLPREAVVPAVDLNPTVIVGLEPAYPWWSWGGPSVSWNFYGGGRHRHRHHHYRGGRRGRR